MTVVATHPLEVRVAELEAENAMLREQFTTLEWKRVEDRFHAFDSIKNDACPCCGGAVKVRETHNAVLLETRDK